METFSDRLATSIEKAGFGRPEFASKAGVGTSALAKWLSGKLTPKSDQLLALARTAGVRMEWLLTGEGLPTTAEMIAGVEEFTGETYPPEMRDKFKRVLENRDAAFPLRHEEEKSSALQSKLELAAKSADLLSKKLREAEAELQTLRELLM